MYGKDFLDERFEIRQALQISMMSMGCIEQFLREARAQADEDNWQDCLVSSRLAKECISNLPASLKRLDDSIDVIIKKIENEKI